MFLTAPPTLADIAREAGVNISRVSRALNGGYGVRKDVRDHVQAVARRLNYRPNLVAKSLVTGRSGSLGLLVSDIRNAFFAELTRGVADAARRSAYDVILCNSDLDPDRQMESFWSLVNKRIDGIVMNSVAFLSRSQIEEMGSAGVPVVLLQRTPKPGPFSVAQPDNEKGGRLAGEYLRSLGHRKIAVLSGPRKHVNLTERAKGFLAAVRGTSVPELIYGRHDSSGGYESALQLFSRHTPVTAVFATNDAIALGVIRAAQEQGIRIPEDLSLVGFDDIDVSAIVHPPLTTVWTPKYELGEACVEILLKMVEKPESPSEHRTFSVKLMVRQSCKAIL